MKVQVMGIGFLLCEACTTWQPTSSPTKPQSVALVASVEGAKYEHRIEKSRFNVGAVGHHEVEGPYERLVGDRGTFFVDTVTGASLADLHGRPMSEYPRPLTQNSREHSAVVRSYLIGAGVPATEVSGTHVTTTMASSGPLTLANAVVPSRPTLLWYTTHLERSLGGIPVEGSFAYASLDSAGEVINEGVYWPAIPASVVSQAQALKQRLDSSSDRSAFLERVRAAAPIVEESKGEVRIVHTSAGYHGAFVAAPVYSVVVRSTAQGRAEMMRFDGLGAPVVMPEERPSGGDSIKQR